MQEEIEELKKKLANCSRRNKALKEHLKNQSICHQAQLKSARDTIFREGEIARKLRCCGNCDHEYYDGHDYECELRNCENKNKWEMKT